MATCCKSTRRILWRGWGFDMKVNLTSPERYAHIIREQKKYARELADRVDRGEPLDEMGSEIVSSLLRSWADKIPEEQPRPRGHQPQFASGAAALYVANRRRRGESYRQAVANVAEHYGVTDESIKKALKKDGDQAQSVIGVFASKT